MSFSYTVFKGSPTEDIVEATTERAALSRNEVHIATTHSGVCGTDLFMRRRDMVLGHEGVGVVKAVGPEVRLLKIGDRVGWGHTTDSCGVCDKCRAGLYSGCPDPSMYSTSSFDTGTFSTGVVVREPYLFRIPDQMKSADAAPMMCAGITVWDVLTQNGCKATDCVGVVGVGGLGHLAIQFAAKLGCQVVAFSGTAAKEEDAMALGAAHFVATKDQTELQLPRKVNHLIITGLSMPDWDLFLPVMETGCTIYPLLATPASAVFSLPHMPFSWQSIRIVYGQGSTATNCDQMLQFAAFHGIKPVIEKFPLTKDGVAESMDKLKEGKIRYRAVLYGEGEG
ncbi:alcohol dehydrogenase [Phlyctema vagabunda]|uniref:Alcohol dehydrogenase n=1 Tax=Phlyctema vagabunda TaxID=108571 RepID=A0ABR4PWQ6_9HELO